MSVSVPPFVVKALFETHDIRRFPFGVDDILAPPDTPRVMLGSAASVSSASAAVATDDEPPKAVVPVTAPAPAPAPAPTTNSFRRLCALLRASFHLSPSEGICVRYEDSEGDMVEIASEMECVEAIRQKAATPKQTLKLFVTRRRSPASSPTVPPNSSADAKASAASMPPLSLSDRPSSAASSASPSSIDAAHKQVDRPVAPVPPVALYNHSVTPTHIDVSCSICKVQPIVGPRFYCTTCCVDLCSRCEERNEHPDDHVLLKARTALECSPLCSHPCPGNCPVVAAHRAYTERVAAARTEAIEQNIVYDSVLVADLSYPDGHSVAPASEITKTWTLRNAGATAWPEGTFLCHRRGALKPVAAFETPRARAGEAVNVSIPVKTPAAMGVARGTYQLFDPIRAEFFGAPVWVDVNVTKAAKLAAAAAAAAAMADADGGDQPDGSMATWNDAEDDAALAIITAEKEAARSRAGASIVVSAAAPAPVSSPSPIAEVKSSACASGESKGDAKAPALSRQLSAPSASSSSSAKPELRNALSLAPYLSAASRAELAAQARGSIDAKSKQKPARYCGPFADEVNRLRDMGFKSDDDELLGWMMAATDLKSHDVDLVQWVAHKLLKREANL